MATVARFTGWEKEKLASLPDAALSGRPGGLNEQKKRLLEYAGKAIRQVKQLVAYVAEHFNKQVSLWTIKRILKAAESY